MFAEIFRPVSATTLALLQGPRHGPPLLLLHGVLRRSNDYVPFFPALSTRWQIQALDFRGHGRSGRVAGRYLVTDYVADVVDLLNSAFDEPVVVYGHSLGAMVALGAAAAAGDRVRAVVLEDPPFHTMGTRIGATSFLSQFTGLQGIVRPGRSLEQLASDLAQLPITFPDRGETRPFGQLRDSVSLRYMASCLTQLDPDVLEPIVAGRWLDGYDWQLAAAALSCPSLLLQADLAAGGMLEPNDAQQYLERARGSHLIRAAGIGHLMHWQATEVTLRSVLAFLESTR